MVNQQYVNLKETKLFRLHTFSVESCALVAVSSPCLDDPTEGVRGDAETFPFKFSSLGLLFRFFLSLTADSRRGGTQNNTLIIT